MRILGVDFGSKRVGVAASDPAGRVALPVGTLINTPDLVGGIMELAGRYGGAKTVVLGESRDYSGRPNPVFEAARSFKEKLEEAGFTVAYEPEFMTSVQAERLQGRNAMNDASAAAIILQSYLDRKNGGGSGDGRKGGLNGEGKNT